jgi:hypothetical protein
MNNKQIEYIAEFVKIVAVAEFGYFGYNGLQAHDYETVFWSAWIFAYLVWIGVVFLGELED